MIVAAADEAPHRGAGADFADAISFAFADPERELYGFARLGVHGGARAAASGLALVFSGGELIAARAEGEGEPGADGWDTVAAGGLSTTVVEPLRRWTVAFGGAPAGAFELEFSALCDPAALADEAASAQLSATTSYEQLCRVGGQVSVDGERRDVACLGQRGHAWGAPDWRRIELARSVGAWLDEDRAVTLSAVRPAGAAGHEGEALAAFLIEGDPPAAVPVARPRLSTAYDAQRRQQRCGIELWPSEESEYPRRAAGETLCGGSLELGRMRLECAFLTWHMEGRSGVGRYEIVRRA